MNPLMIRWVAWVTRHRRLMVGFMLLSPLVLVAAGLNALAIVLGAVALAATAVYLTH